MKNPEAEPCHDLNIAAHTPNDEDRPAPISISHGATHFKLKSKKAGRCKSMGAMSLWHHRSSGPKNLSGNLSQRPAHQLAFARGTPSKGVLMPFIAARALRDTITDWAGPRMMVTVRAACRGDYFTNRRGGVYGFVRQRIRTRCSEFRLRYSKKVAFGIPRHS